MRLYITVFLAAAQILAQPASGTQTPCGRMISMAPSITETLYALGLGANVVGVTTFCERPKEAASKPKVGGYFDVNYEAALALRPTLVVIHGGRGDQEERFKRLGVKAVSVDHTSVNGIIGSIKTVGSLCGVDENAKRLVNNLRERMDKIRAKVNGAAKPRVLVAVGRNIGSTSVAEAYIAGKKSYYDDLITLAGGFNAYEGVAVATPMVSAEGIIWLKPDYVIELIPPLDGKAPDPLAAEKDWAKLSAMGGGFKTRVIVGGHTVIPGPDFVALLEEMAKIIHPEIAWE
jgi:iron complex transport system substrate-binding protein